MKKTPLPTLQQIEELTVFLPRLYAEGFSPVLRWYGGKQKDGTFTLPYPDYDPLVKEFFSVAANECWRDYDYHPDLGYQMLQDENFGQNCFPPSDQDHADVLRARGALLGWTLGRNDRKGIYSPAARAAQ